jgi:hypothetical protein
MAKNLMEGHPPSIPELRLSESDESVAITLQEEEEEEVLPIRRSNIDHQRVRLRQSANDANLGFREYHKSAGTWKLVDDILGSLVAIVSALTATLLGLQGSNTQQYSFACALTAAVVSAAHTSIDASGKWHTRQTISTKYRELNEELNLLLSREPTRNTSNVDKSREWSILARDADSRMSLIRSLEHDGLLFDSIKQKDRLLHPPKKSSK